MPCFFYRLGGVSLVFFTEAGFLSLFNFSQTGYESSKKLYILPVYFVNISFAKITIHIYALRKLISN